MTERYRDPDPDSPKNPPRAVTNPGVRRAALGAYLGPIVILFAIVGIALLYWATRPPARVAEGNGDEPRAEGTTGEPSPGGRSPDPVPRSTRDEIERRLGDPITELGEILEVNARGTVGRRIEIRDVDVERVESPTIFWIRDGNARVAVFAPEGSASVQPGESITVMGTVERSGDSVRIRASRVEASR